MKDTTFEEKIPASLASTEPSGKAAGKKALSPTRKSRKSFALAVVVVGILGATLALLSSMPSGSTNDNTGEVQGFGICDDGGSADGASLAVDMDELTTFAAMRAWAPEVELTNQQLQLGRYTMVGRAQLDKCRILALVDNATGEYYAFVFMLDEQGSYIVGMSRANLNEAPDNLPDKMLTRPRQ